MNFQEAFELMNNGKKIRRPFWVDGRYWFIKNYALWSSFAGGTKVLPTSYEPLTLLEMCSCNDWMYQNEAGEWVSEFVQRQIKPANTVTVADLKTLPAYPVFWEHECKCVHCGFEIQGDLYHAKVWHGAWMVLCEACFNALGGRIGPSVGQHYTYNGEKFQLVEE